jgi:hypothetical protein
LVSVLPGVLSGAAVPTVQQPAKVIRDIPYSDAAKGDRRRSFDLYLPAKASAKPPLDFRARRILATLRR